MEVSAKNSMEVETLSGNDWMITGLMFNAIFRIQIPKVPVMV